MADKDLISREMRVAVSLGRKVNIGNYESIDIFMAVSGIEPGATDAEIQEALATGEQAFQLLVRKMQDKLGQVKRGDVL